MNIRNVQTIHYYFSDDENITNPKVTIDQEDLDFDFSSSVDIRAETKLSTEFASRAETKSSTEFTSRAETKSSTEFSSRAETKSSTEFTSRTNQVEDTIQLDKMMNRVTMDEEVDIDSVDIGSMPIFDNSRHIDVQMTMDNDFPLWAGDTSARRSPEGLL